MKIRHGSATLIPDEPATFSHVVSQDAHGEIQAAIDRGEFGWGMLIAQKRSSE
jgi:hypothetical protein